MNLKFKYLFDFIKNNWSMLLISFTFLWIALAGLFLHSLFGGDFGK